MEDEGGAEDLGDVAGRSILDGDDDSGDPEISATPEESLKSLGYNVDAEAADGRGDDPTDSGASVLGWSVTEILAALVTVFVVLALLVNLLRMF